VRLGKWRRRPSTCHAPQLFVKRHVSSCGPHASSRFRANAQPCHRQSHLTGTSHIAPQAQRRSIQMEIAAIIMLSSIVLYMLQQVDDVVS